MLSDFYVESLWTFPALIVDLTCFEQIISKPTHMTILTHTHTHTHTQSTNMHTHMLSVFQLK